MNPTTIYYYSAGGFVLERKTAGASGFDLHANEDVPVTLRQRYLINTGIHLAMPLGVEAQVRPRSGWGLRGIVAVFGTIDADYRGNVGVNLINHDGMELVISPGDRIAQLVFAPVIVPGLELQLGPYTLERVEHLSDLPPSERGAAGWGSTGR